MAKEPTVEEVMETNYNKSSEKEVPPEEAPPSPHGQTDQRYDGEADPAIIIKARNEERAYKQAGLEYPPVAPMIGSLMPDSAEIGGDDFILNVIGDQFTADTQIIFNGGEEPTEKTPEGTLTTIVRPSLVETAIEVPVKVRNSVGESNELPFKFTAPSTRKAKSADVDEEEEDEETTSGKKGKSKK